MRRGVMALLMAGALLGAPTSGQLTGRQGVVRLVGQGGASRYQTYATETVIPPRSSSVD